MVTKCNRCGNEIEWTKRNDKNIPVNKNGKDHRQKFGDDWKCTDENGNAIKSSQGNKQQELPKLMTMQEAIEKLDQIHVNAVVLCKKYAPSIFTEIDAHGVQDSVQWGILQHYERLFAKLLTNR